MKLFVVSDIHGYADLLKKSLSDAGYDSSNKDHLLVCCGDLFDRGTQNLEVLKFFESIDRKVVVKGNHEERLQETIDTGCLDEHDYTNGTVNTIQEFFGKYSVFNDKVDFSGKTSMVNRISEFVGEMRDYFETEHYIFLHGWLPNENGRNASKRQWYISRWTWWLKGIDMTGNKETKTIVCGHFPTLNSEILFDDGFIAIDAGTDSRKKVNVLVIDDSI